MLPQFQLLKPAIAKLTPFFLYTISFSLFAPLLPTPVRLSAHVEAYSPLPVSAQTTDSRITEAKRLLQQGLQQSRTSQYQAAIQSLEQALGIYRAISNRLGEANALNNLGQNYYSLLQYDKAIEFYEQALIIYRAIQNRDGEAIALNNLGQSYSSLSQYDKAIALYQQALAIYRTSQSHLSEANALINLGQSYSSLSQYDKAIALYQQALVIYRTNQSSLSEANALTNLGQAYILLSQYDKAIKLHQQALIIYRAAHSRIGEANAVIDLGRSYYSLARYGKAIELYQQALVIYRTAHSRVGEANALINLGQIHSALSQHDKAIELHQQALAVYRTLDNRNGEANALDNLGRSYYSLARYDKAIELDQQALVIYRATQNRRGKANALNNLGYAYSLLSQPDKAIECHQQALTLSRQINNRSSEARALNALGTAYHFSSQYDKAVASSQQALLIYRAIGDRAGEGNTLSNLGLTLLKIGDAVGAEKASWAAIKLWESLRPGLTDDNKISLFETQINTYRTLQQALTAQKKPLEALEAAERGRTRAFVELLETRMQEGKVPLRSSSQVTVATIDQIKRIAKTHSATLVEYSIIYDYFQIQGKQAWHESALYIWVIQPTGDVSFHQVDLKPLWQLHNASLSTLVIGNEEFLAVRDRGVRLTKLQPDLPTLHQLLIAPIASLLPKDPKDHVIFIPQGILFQVPFPALQDANGNYLIKKHTILTAPSIQVLALTRRQQQKRNARTSPKAKSQKALVVGNPTMPTVFLTPREVFLTLGVPPTKRLSSLPGAEAEANAIATLLHTQAITGAQGTKATIVPKMAQASIIHLATHGLLDDVRGLGSAIALAPSGKDSGWLTAAEILDMKLQANLVVLSACNTAQGRTTGDGIIGLSRSFISAGVPSVIVSLWAIPDAPTAALMETFYQNLEKNPDKAQALRQAMLTTMKTHPEPRDWAAFTLIGEAE